MKTKLSSVRCPVFVLAALLLLVSCSNGPITPEEYEKILVDWPYSVFVVHRYTKHWRHGEDDELWNEFHRRFRDLLHKERIEYINQTFSHSKLILYYVKNEDCQHAMTIINRYVNIGGLHVVSWSDMIRRRDDDFPLKKYVSIQPGITFGYDTWWKPNACPALDK